jgi:CBS domain containing-hemolysin-like protein
MKGLKTPAQIVKPVVFVTKTIKIAKLLRTLQEKKSHLAVVVDEHGGTLGIVTIEDIVEELVGEIWDEHDEVVESIKENIDGSFTVIGSVNFKDMVEEITEKESQSAPVNTDEIPETTVANWCMETLGRLPRAGEMLTWQSFTIRVLKIVKQRIMEVKVTLNSNTDKNK